MIRKYPKHLNISVTQKQLDGMITCCKKFNLKNPKYDIKYNKSMLCYLLFAYLATKTGVKNNYSIPVPRGTVCILDRAYKNVNWEKRFTGTFVKTINMRQPDDLTMCIEGLEGVLSVKKEHLFRNFLEAVIDEVDRINAIGSDGYGN